MNKTHFCQLSANTFNRKNIPNLSLFQKISSFIREFTTISENYPVRKHYFRSLKSYQDERNNHTQGKYWFTIHPLSNFQYFRHILMAIIYVSVVISDQIDIAFLSKYNTFVKSADTIMFVINAIAFVDLILHFITGYILQREKTNLHYNTGYYKTAETATILNKKKIALRYIKTFFIVDIFSLTNILYLVSDVMSRDVGFYYVYAGLRHIRVIRIFTVERTSDLLLNKMRFKRDSTVILQCLVLYAFCSMFFGTMLIYVPEIISYIYDKNKSSPISRLEVYYYRANKTLSSADIFMQTTYDAFCLLTVFQTKKEDDKTVELYIIIIATMIVGNILKIFVFISIYSILSRKFQSTIDHIIFMKEVKNFIGTLDLSKQLSLDVYNYVDVKLKKEYFKETEIQNTLQKRMLYEIFAESSMGLIRNCHLFKNLPNYFLVQLSLKLICETYVPGVTVITVGEIATCMYFIATGTVAVYSADGTELCHLSDGEYVGEIGILQSTARVADIVTIEHCELYRLDIKDFQEVIKPNSKFYRRIYKIAMKRMNVHVNMETENKK